MLSVEQVAERLGLHVRTVRGYVRDGKLKAVRIGKQYRVSEADLAEFTGAAAAVSVEVTAIAQVDGITRTGLDRLTTLLTAGVTGVRVQTVHDPERAQVRVILFGPAEPVADVLRLIAAVREDL